MRERKKLKDTPWQISESRIFVKNKDFLDCKFLKGQYFAIISISPTSFLICLLYYEKCQFFFLYSHTILTSTMFLSLSLYIPSSNIALNIFFFLHTKQATKSASKFAVFAESLALNRRARYLTSWVTFLALH